MRKSLTYKILLSVLALTAINYALPANTTAGKVNDDYYVDYDGETVSGNFDFDNVYGNGHSFTITGGKIINVYGVGNGNYDKDASGGNVTINGNANVSYLVYGGRSDKGEAYNNTVNISGDNSSVRGVYGGMSSSGNAHHNTVNISGGTVEVCVYGGMSGSGAFSTSAGEVHHNTVNISGGTVGYVYGGMSGSGAFSTSAGEVHHNTVNISGGTVGYVYGGMSRSSGQAHHNTVNINGDAEVTGDVCGSYSENSNAYDNTVNISGGIIGEADDIVNIYGGYIDHSGIAYDNEVVISGSADITYANLYGYGGDPTNATGNTLTINGWSGSTQSVQNFNDIAFKNINWNDGGKILIIMALSQQMVDFDEK